MGLPAESFAVKIVPGLVLKASSGPNIRGGECMDLLTVVLALFISWSVTKILVYL